MLHLNMKKILIITIPFLILLVICYSLVKSNQSLKRDIDNYAENLKSYEMLYSEAESNNRIFRLSIEQVKSSKDSIFQKMVSLQKELRIKDRNIAQLQYKLSTIKKTDTILLRDTIFVPDFELDTLFGDKWFTQRLHLKYPNYITSSPEIQLENYILLNNKKETVKPRKKFFLWRWFQRKHTITEVKVIEKNKYVKDSISRFIIITK